MGVNRKTNRDHAKKTTRPMVEEEVIAGELEAVLTPAITAQENYYGSGTKRTPVITLRLIEVRSGKIWHSYLTSVLDPTICTSSTL
ncbi:MULTISPECIES: hypothetical protein [unclassified Coleofasciculus]|uniref:hypothetical protein n=1 Tax=unclassified Coleofasciculus TaxID=2692782 RepID=UPI00187EDF0A|nr:MULTISPECIES: hypothetical protein [unclassified Coleofasciculus]MBE9126333.1 hypothetical protein [Coleofasciculus sp. LEGE 07081]MBE9147490.1 hypothetical protein [Coleofasciculus sp. LEGE 07092]